MKATVAGLTLCLALLAMAPHALAQGAAPVTLRGQVVCSECWFEADDRKAKPYGTESDVKCAVRCDKDGVAQALAVWEGDAATLYLLEKGALGKDGASFLTYIGKEVEITGSTRVADAKKHVKVDTLKVISAGPAEAAPPPGANPPVAGVPSEDRHGEDRHGAKTPELALRDLSGGEQTLSGYRGRSIVVLNFWATWCVPCRKEMPAFVNLQSQYAAWGVQIIAASADAAETRDQVVKFTREKKLNFPVWVGATTGDMERFGLGSELPGTVIIDRDGTVVARIKGIVDEADLRKRIDALVEKHAAEAAAPGPGAARHGHADVATGGSKKSSVPS